MAKSIGDGKVHKSLVMDRGLAGAIGAWAAGAGVGFSEAVRLLCAQALAEWPDAAGAVVDELRCVERRLSGDLLHVSTALARLESQHSDLLAALEGAGDDDGGAECHYSDYGDMDADGDEPEDEESEWGGGFDAEEFDREFDEWWEARKHEWD